MDLSEQDKDGEQVIDLLFQLGATYLEKEDYENAIDKFKKILELGEANGKVYLNLSKAFILREQFDAEAQEIYEKALQFEPENPVLNVILGQMYLDAGREDEQALSVFQNALKHNPQNADKISSKLIKASFQQGNIDVARDFMQQFIDNPEKVSNFLPLYIVNEWKHQGFDRVAKYLKQVISSQENPEFYRWIAVNFLQAEKQSMEQLHLSLEDLNLCKRYLDNIKSLDQLLDIYLYPSVEQFVLKYSQNFDESMLNQVEEYEIFLADNAFTNIWERALNKNHGSLDQLIPGEESVWKKLKLWYVLPDEGAEDPDSYGPETNDIDAIFTRANVVMALRLKGANAEDISDALVTAVSTAVSDVAKPYVVGFKSSDGFLFFWKDVDNSIQMAVNFIQDYLENNCLNGNEAPKIQFVIHKISRRIKNRKRSATDDLQVALSAFQLEKEMFFQDYYLDQWKSNTNYQLLITSPLKDKINGKDRYRLEPVELSIQHPTSEKSYEIFQVTWDDSYDRVKRGDLQEIGRFKLLKELHQNQFFLSFKAVDSFLDRLVIIKILRPEVQIDGDQNLKSKTFLHEAKLLGKISHPNVALVYDIGEERDFCYIAREYIEGVPLTIQRSINQKINVVKTLKICLNLVQILNSIHQQKVYHGRLQPNNIFVLNNQEVRIADFQIPSLAIPLKFHQTSSLKYLTYFAPEQIDDRAFNRMTDIFSLGVIMYEILTGNNPFYDEDRTKVFDNIRNKTPEPLSSHNPELPAELDEIVLKTLEKSPKKRYDKLGLLEKQLAELVGRFDNN